MGGDTDLAGICDTFVRFAFRMHTTYAAFIARFDQWDLCLDHLHLFWGHGSGMKMGCVGMDECFCVFASQVCSLGWDSFHISSRLSTDRSP